MVHEAELETVYRGQFKGLNCDLGPQKECRILSQANSRGNTVAEEVTFGGSVNVDHVRPDFVMVDDFQYGDFAVEMKGTINVECELYKSDQADESDLYCMEI